MSFGMYRPQMGVAHGHRELSSNQTLLEQRRHNERTTRQENPITHQPDGRPPSGNLQRGLVPSKGPLDHVTVPNRDVPARRPDPTKNHSTNLQTGIACVPTSALRQRSVPSRVTESILGEGFLAREPTPERRTSPGQVVRSSVRPKDNLSSGCITADRQDHPLNLPRQAGSAPAGVGTGGVGHIAQGPFGFVPQGPFDFYGEQTEVPGAHQARRSSSKGAFKPVWGDH
mmetsp:Transcript_80043/g.158566  ORF Transcript_80043/g.158566 Transcript_80043/m.158566 type:complete len:228 (-) Transcript_80043:77-760(-)